MLMKIGDVTSKFGISHRSLHYWESSGILKSTRAENEYRYYDEENCLKIKQIVLLRKLRLSIPSIQEIFTSNELSKVITVFTDHLDETKRETEQLNSLGIILRQLLNMLKDKQDMNSVYNYLDSNHSSETDELKAALKTVLSEPVKDITVEALPETVIDMTDVNLLLEPVSPADILELERVIRRCYTNTKEIDELIDYFNLEGQINMPDCTRWYKIIQGGGCIGAVNIAYAGRESIIVRNIAYMEPDNNVYIFELLKRKYPETMSWLVFLTSGNDNRYCYHDCEMKKQQFLEDNGFHFLTNANDRNQYEYLTKPYYEIYNNGKYRYAITDGSMDNICHRFSVYSSWDFYDGMLFKSRFTDFYLAEALIYASGMERSKFYSDYMGDCDFRYTSLERSKFIKVDFKDCEFINCDLKGVTIDGINVEEALESYKKQIRDR